MGDRDVNDGPRIVVLIAGGALAYMLVNRLEEHFGSISVLKEDPRSKVAIVRRRARLIGWRQALRQAAFGLLQKCVARRSAGRLAAIWREHGLNPAPPRTAWQQIGSVNAPAAQAALRRLAPDVVIVYGTRIIKWRTPGFGGGALHQLPCRHQSQVPRTERRLLGTQPTRRHHAGVTVHLIDEGIDTGGVLYQGRSTSRPTTTSPPTRTGKWPQPCPSCSRRWRMPSRASCGRGASNLPSRQVVPPGSCGAT